MRDVNGFDVGSPAPRPAAQQPTEPSDTKSVSVIEDGHPSRTEPADAVGLVVKEATGEPTVQTHRDDATEFAGDFPSYLRFAVDPQSTMRSPDGCKHLFGVLSEMSGESRDELWAPRVERELRTLLEQHPLGFRVSVGCRATVCQITNIGPVTAILENEAAFGTYWSNFEDNLRNAPIASELATRRFFTAEYPEDPTQAISGYVFTSVGQATPSEPPHCAPFHPHSRSDRKP